MELVLDCYTIFDFVAIVAAVREEQHRLAGEVDEYGNTIVPLGGWGTYEVSEDAVSYTTASGKGRLTIFCSGLWKYTGFRNSISGDDWDCVLPRLPEKFTVIWFASATPWRKPVVAGVEIDVHTPPPTDDEEEVRENRW